MQPVLRRAASFLGRRKKTPRCKTHPKILRIALAATLLMPVTIARAGETNSATPLPRMHWADTISGAPLSKDPAVVRFHDAYWLYYSIPPYKGKTNKGWTIGVAKSDNLVDWQKVGELKNTGEAEKNGFTAPGAIVLDGKIHLFLPDLRKPFERRDLPCLVRGRSPLPARSDKPHLPAHRRLELRPRHRRRRHRTQRQTPPLLGHPRSGDENPDDRRCRRTVG